MTKKLDIKLALLMSRFIRRIIVLDRNEKMCHGVTLSQHYTIDALHRKQNLNMNELSKELNLAISTLTRIIDILVRDGIVERKSSPGDRRKVCVSLTEKGVEKAERLKACTERFWTSIADSIPENKKREVVENLKLLVGVLEETEGSRCPYKDSKIAVRNKRD